MREDISIDNLQLIHDMKCYFAKVALSLSPEEQHMFERVIERLKYAEY